MLMAAAVAQWVGWSLTTRHLMAGGRPIGGYALPTDSLGLASATLGATLALSVLGWLCRLSSLVGILLATRRNREVILGHKRAKNFQPTLPPWQ